MDGKNSKTASRTFKSSDATESNSSVPRGLMLRELGHKQKLSSASHEFQAIAEDKLVLKQHEELRCELPGPSRSTFLMVFSPDGTKVASTHGNHNVYVTDLTTGKNVKTLSGHPRTPWCIAFHPSSNQILASGCLGGQVRVWDLHGGSEVWMADGQTVIASLAFHPTDRMLVIATYNELHFWDWSQPEPFTKCYTSNEKEKVRYVTFDPLGHKLVTGISNAPQVQSQWDQWDRVPSMTPIVTGPSPTSQPQRSLMSADRERRITVCYRSLVEQYEQLVQRYFDLSRSRSISTMDRGTDPMDFESETSALGSRPRDTSCPSDYNSNSNNSSGSRWRDPGRHTCATHGRALNALRLARELPEATRNELFLQAMFNPWPRCRQETSQTNRTDSAAAAASETEPVAGPSSGSQHVLQSQSSRSENQRTYVPPFHMNNPHLEQTELFRRRYCTTHLETPRPLNRNAAASASRDIHMVPEATQSAQGPPPGDAQPDRANRDRPSSPLFSPSRNRRFFVSQSSAFQPRAPRTDQSSESRSFSRSTLPRRTTQRISLNAATAAAVAAMPDRRTPDSDPPRSRSPLSPLSSPRSRNDLTDIGVRYGIQLLSRHIDNMQRLCRARLEILQLQQIRRMWEDLQHQIRSLHSAVRESGINLPRLAENSTQETNRFSCTSPFRMNDNMAQGTSTSRDATENGSDGNGGHIPSVSQMLELARISDSSPATNRESTSQNTTECHEPGEEVFQAPVGSTRIQESTSGADSTEPGSSSPNNASEDSNSQQYSMRYQMLQQRLWRISRKVYLRRPRLLTVNSRCMRRQLSSSHSSLNRGGCSHSRYSDTSRRPWFLHSVARHHRTGTKSTNNVSSQVGPSSPPGQADGKVEASETPSNSESPSANLDDSQPGPSGLCTRSSSIDFSDASREPECITIEDDDYDDDDDDDDEVPPRRPRHTGIKKDNEQQCSLPSGSAQKTELNNNPSTSRNSNEAQGSTSEEPSVIRRRLLEEIDRLFPTTPVNPSPDNAGPSTSQGPTSTSPRDRAMPQEPSACKSLWSMIARLERLVQQQREQRERFGSGSHHSHNRRSSMNTWSLRDRAWQRLENSGSDSDSNTETERPRTWGRLSAEQRLSNALQNERYERDRMCRAAANAQNNRGQLDEDWEWTRESTRLRARQVLSLMVESLTQFFEENGLSSATPHAVLDEQIYNLHILLQLALELTDLLLAQLICTRRELEHQWVHRLRSPVALAADEVHNREGDRDREMRGRGRQEEASTSMRMSPYRRLYRHRLSVDGEGNSRPERFRGRTEYSRRLTSRVMNCLTRHNRLSPSSSHGTGVRPGRNAYSRPMTRPVIARHPSLRRVDADSTSSNTSPGHEALSDRQSTAASEASTSTSANIPTSQSHDAFTVPLVRVNDVLIPDTSLLNQPRTRPQSPPLPHPNSPFANPFSQASNPEPRSRTWDYWPYVPGSSWRPRFLHPRYMASNAFNDDSEDSVNGADNFTYYRANSVPETVIITDAPMTPNHRIQVWDFSKFHIPDISDGEKNLIVPECKIHNDASVDVSKDGRLLVTLLPSGRQSITTMLGVYSLQWESLGQCLYTTSFLQSAVSVSLSPASRYLLVGLASRRVALLPNDRHYMAQVFRLDGAKPGRNLGGRGRLCHMRDIEQSRDQGYMSLNCIRWAPGPGQGFVYGTNTGQLRVLR